MTRVFFLLLTAICFTPAVGFEDESGREVSLPYVSLVRTPQFVNVPERSLSTDEINQIEQLIADLADLDVPLDFFSESLFFLPGDRLQALVNDSQSEPLGVSTVRKLLDFGPAVVPALLEHLSDSTRTATTIQSDKDDDIITLFADRMHGNAANIAEATILGLTNDCYVGKATVPELHPFEMPEHSQVESYTFRIGDVCFVLLGQIVGRDYQSLLMPEKYTIALCSPVFDFQLRRKVLQLWSSPKPRRLVFRSLLFDFCTEGIVRNDALDEWDQGNTLQLAATYRLLRYFPDESQALVLDRLSGLDVESRFFEGAKNNGLRAHEFIAVVAEFPSPAVIDALKSLRATCKERSSLSALSEALDPDLKSK